MCLELRALSLCLELGAMTFVERIGAASLSAATLFVGQHRVAPGAAIQVVAPGIAVAGRFVGGEESVKDFVHRPPERRPPM